MQVFSYIATFLALMLHQYHFYPIDITILNVVFAGCRILTNRYNRDQTTWFKMYQYMFTEGLKKWIFSIMRDSFRFGVKSSCVVTCAESASAARYFWRTGAKGFYRPHQWRPVYISLLRWLTSGGLGTAVHYRKILWSRSDPDRISGSRSLFRVWNWIFRM